MARITTAQLMAEIEALRAQLASSPATPAVASAHWRERDIACSAVKPCVKTFRTVKGRDWHTANVKH